MLIKNNIQTITGAKSVINTLKSLGVNTIFGYPGGIVLDLYDELYNQKDIRHILVRHEQAAVHAAEGYARATGKCGVVLVTSGPGATNTVTGIVNAYHDGYPLIIMTGQVDKNLIGKNAFQEANICEITRSCTKAVFQITDAKNIQKTIIKAHKIATSGKQGPVVIDMAKNIFTENTAYEENIQAKDFNVTSIIDTDIERIYNRLINSERPVIITGGGVNHSACYQELEQFVTNYNIPVVSTMMGLGAVERKNPLYFGMVGIFGDKSANEILKQSDLIISLGARFNDRITCTFKNDELRDKIIQIEINPEEIANNIKPKDYIIGDIKDFLSKMNSLNASIFKEKFTDYNLSVKNLKCLNKPSKKQTNMLHSFEIMQKLQEFTKDKNVIFTSEVGQHQLWAVKELSFNPNRKIFVSGGSGTMGFGLPAAIGASIAMPDKTVVCITGDGSFQMSLSELSVCKDFGLNIKIIILNNGYLGMVRQLQQNNFGERYSQTKISNPNFVQLAQSFGIDAIKVNNSNDIENAFEKAFKSIGTYIIDCETEPMETV
ncbi:biosynthetic-type acetolactate synthase large subunit [bacterium]|nr:biosynthetic-type acetolactate synthase large subunit [bacterium]